MGNPLVRRLVRGLGWRARPSPAVTASPGPPDPAPSPEPGPPSGAATMDSQTSQSSQASQSPHTFQVDLRGLVDLLSHHLYSSPRVYLRELLQNAVDAVTARCEEEDGAARRVRIVPADVSPDGMLHVDDTGIGLDEDGIRGVLATIGASTKRDALGLARESFLGQFGIGLLSCFLVTDEIRVTTRRAGTDETWLW